MAEIKFTDTLKCTATHNKLASASQIYDDTSTDALLKNKKQSDINTYLLENLGNGGASTIPQINTINATTFTAETAKTLVVGNFYRLVFSNGDYTDGSEKNKIITDDDNTKYLIVDYKGNFIWVNSRERLNDKDYVFVYHSGVIVQCISKPTLTGTPISSIDNYVAFLSAFNPLCTGDASTSNLWYECSEDYTEKTTLISTGLLYMTNEEFMTNFDYLHSLVMDLTERVKTIEEKLNIKTSE